MPRNDSGDVVWFEALDDRGNPIPVLIDEVVGDTVFVRHLDPAEEPGGRVPLEPGQSVLMTTPIAAVGLHTSDQVGANDMMFGLRVVPDGRAPGTVYARTLRFDELDDGRRVHVRPGESLTLAPGAVTVQLDAIDVYYRKVDPARPEGTLASALRVWFGLGTGRAPEIQMLTSAAAYRLDAAHHLLQHAEAARSSLQQAGDHSAAAQVAKVDELVHLVQEGIVDRSFQKYLKRAGRQSRRSLADHRTLRLRSWQRRPSTVRKNGLGRFRIHDQPVTFLRLRPTAAGIRLLVATAFDIPVHCSAGVCHQLSWCTRMQR